MQNLQLVCVVVLSYINSVQGQDSMVGVTTIQGSSPGGGKIFCTHLDRPWNPPSLLHEGYWVFPGVKVVEAWC